VCIQMSDVFITGDRGSLDLSEAPERLCDLFNHEGAILTAPCFCLE
jgi:hypothetical protein